MPPIRCAVPDRARLAPAWAALLLALVLALVLTTAARAAVPDAGVPDPLANGTHAVDKIDYEAGTVLLTHPTTGEQIPAPIRGSVTYPTDTTDPGRVIVLVHGRHTACLGTPPAGSYFCEDETTPDGTPTNTPVRSYGGYDYMARNLATHGYVVMSIEANTTNFDNNWKLPDPRFASTSCAAWCDGGANARSMIIDASLNLLFRWNKGAGPYVPGEPQHTVGTKLVGKVDFANGIGMMGHSRGGDAVTDYIGYNRNKTGGARRFVIDAVIALAPVNYTRNKVPYGTNYAVLLPACDGDVSTLQGARFYENAKTPLRRPTTQNPNPVLPDTFAKVQWYVQGTNHNFFNTVWTDDDSSTTTDPACARSQPTTARLSPTDQRRVGQALMNGFFRRYVGNEKAFEPLMTGEVTLPASAKPLTSGKGLDQTVLTSYSGPVAKRLDVVKPTPVYDDGDAFGAGDLAQLTTTATGGALTADGLSKFAICQPADVVFRQGPTLDPATGYELCPRSSTTNAQGVTTFTSRNRSIQAQYVVEWGGKATLTAALGTDGATKDVSKFGVLDLRAAVNRWDAKNPQTNGFDPASATQDFDVTLVDAAGTRVTTNAAKWSKALQPSIGNQLHVVLNGIRIPLTAFDGVDLTKVAAIELGFGTRTASGSIQLADIGFQEDAVPVIDEEEPSVVLPPDGPPSVAPGPVLAPTPAQVTALSTACLDKTAPTTSLGRMAIRNGRLTVSGVAADAGCAGGVDKTLVSIYRKAGGRCSYVTSTGRLGKPAACRALSGVLAKGRNAWSLSLPAKALKKGSYSVKISTFDKAGNVKSLRLLTLRVR